MVWKSACIKRKSQRKYKYQSILDLLKISAALKFRIFQLAGLLLKVFCTVFVDKPLFIF